jgi:plasmid stability protein
MQEEQPKDRVSSKAGESERQEKHLRTLVVRLDEGIHARLQFIAQLRGSSISDEIRRAVENRIETAQDDPDLIARAQEVREEIEREAAARSAAIAGFLGSPAVEAAVDVNQATSGKARRGSQAADA